MITITNTITIAFITIINIAITIISISAGPNAHTYVYNHGEASSWFCSNSWIGYFVSPLSNSRPFLQNLRLQLSTPSLWGIMGYCLGGHAKDKYQTMILTDIIILATLHHLPPVSCLQVSGSEYSASLLIEHPGANIYALCQVRLGVSYLLRVYGRGCLPVFLRVSWEHAEKHTVKQAGSEQSDDIGRILCSMVGSVLQNVLVDVCTRKCMYHMANIFAYAEYVLN